MEIQPISTLNTFIKCSCYKERAELYGSDENFLEHGIGYALCVGSDVVTEEYASIGGGYAELSVITHPDCRGKGNAKYIVSHLIKQCIAAKITPKLSCNVDNRSSLNIALKINNYHMFLTPDCGNILCRNLVDWLKNNPNLEL